MNTDEFWALVAEAGRESSDAGAAAGQAVAMLAGRDAASILGCHRHIQRVLAASYRVDLWGAAYLINGGCSADGFESFRGWLMTQGRATFARAVTEPDTLADLPAVRRAAVTGEEFGCEAMLDVARDAHLKMTGVELPKDPVRQPELNDFWDFDDEGEMGRRLPRLAALFNEAPEE